MSEFWENSQPLPSELVEKIVTLLRHMFHNKFCSAENVPQHRKCDIEPLFFYTWLDKNMSLLNAVDECEAAGVEDIAWNALRTILDRGAAPESLYGVWYAIILSDRPELTHKVSSINLVAVLTYEDGTISTTQAFVDRSMVEGPPFNDNIIASMLRSNMKGLLDQIAKMGIDKLHELAKSNSFTSAEPEDPFNVMMGMMIKHLIPQLKPGLQVPVQNYMRLAQQLIRPVVLPEVAAKIKAANAKQHGKDTGKPRGGWDA